MLSSLAPSPMTVAPRVARSMQVLAPISTSLPIRRFHLRDFAVLAGGQFEAKTVGADDGSGVEDAVPAYGYPGVDGDAGGGV